MNDASHTRQASAGFAIALILTATGWAVQRQVDPQVEVETSRVMVVGVQGMSWDVVLELIEEGKLPTMAHLAEGASAGADIIASGYGNSGEVLASIVTGKFTAKHNIHGFSEAARFREEADPGSVPVWELLSRCGDRIGVVGFPFWAPIERGGTWVVPDWTTLVRDWLVYEAGQPIDVRNVWSKLIVTPRQVSPNDIRMVSRNRELAPTLERLLREELAADRTLAAFAFDLYRAVPDAHVFLYLQGLSRVEQRLVGTEPDLQREIIKGYHETLDQVVTDLHALDDGRTTFLLFSEAGNDRGAITYRRRFPKLDRWPPIGWLLTWGRGIKAGIGTPIVWPVDVATTALYITDNTIPNNMDGNVLFELLDDDYFHKHSVPFAPF